jgi:ATP phosphoribosyltransferase
MAALILAVPSKGRLQEQVARYLADAGLALNQSAGARDYRATLAGQPEIEVQLLSAADVAAALAGGDVHLGVSGEDLIRESDPTARGAVHLLQPLGFGFANVVVAVPRLWIDVATMADLDDVCTGFHGRHHRRLRVATKYLALTRSFFAEHGIGDYRIVESLGATEGAPAAGTAEAIVDITTTGTTLAANDLKILDDGVILKSQAQLAASSSADWNANALRVAEQLTLRIAARELARNAHILRVRLTDSRAVSDLAALGCSTISAPAAGGGGEYAILCPRSQLMEAMVTLRASASEATFTVHDVDYAFAKSNPIMERLTAALRG